MAACHYSAFTHLSLSFPVEEVGHHSNPFQEIPEASWISYEQMPVMNSRESDLGGVVALCWAGEVEGEWQATIARGRRSFDRRQAQMLPPQEGGCMESELCTTMICRGYGDYY